MIPTNSIFLTATAIVILRRPLSFCRMRLSRLTLSLKQKIIAFVNLSTVDMVAANGHIEIFQRIIDIVSRNLDKKKVMLNFRNFRNSDGNTPLHTAVI
jgi:ankyrin repeat protein